MANAFLSRMRNEQEWPWEAKAIEELNEVPETNEQKLSDLKDKITEYAKAHPKFRPQLDDELLMAYLRTCCFDVEVAMNCYKKFYKARLCKPEKILPVGKGPKDYMKYYEKPITAFLPQRNPLDGSLILVYSFRNFDSNSDEIEDIFNAVFLVLMEVVLDPSIQVHGVRFIIDYTGVDYSVMMSTLGKMYYNKASLLAQENCPLRAKGCHVLNAPRWIVTIFYSLFRPFLSKELRDCVQFHSSTAEMHKYISPSILPDIFDGSAGPWNGTWMREAVEERHEEVVRKSYFGFIDV